MDGVITLRDKQIMKSDAHTRVWSVLNLLCLLRLMRFVDMLHCIAVIWGSIIIPGGGIIEMVRRTVCTLYVRCDCGICVSDSLGTGVFRGLVSRDTWHGKLPFSDQGQRYK